MQRDFESQETVLEQISSENPLTLTLSRQGRGKHHRNVFIPPPLTGDYPCFPPPLTGDYPCFPPPLTGGVRGGCINSFSFVSRRLMIVSW